MPPSQAVHRNRAGTALVAAAGLTLALYFIPYGLILVWPLLLLSTLIHELGHGLAALLLGGQFDRLALYADGSGVAFSSGPFGDGQRALIAAAGLIGPPLAAAGLFAAGRRGRGARTALGVLAALLLLALLLWLRNFFGIAFTALLAGVLLALSLRGSQAANQIACVFLAIQLSLSVFSRSDYLFTSVAQTAAGRMPSDVARIAEGLWLPYWFWGALIGLLSLAILFAGTRAFLREQ